MRPLFTLAILFLSIPAWAQQVAVRGTVYNAITREPIPFAAVSVVGKAAGAISDENGNFVIAELAPGFYTFECTALGFKPLQKAEIQILASRERDLEFALEENNVAVAEVEVVADARVKRAESPVSVRSIGATEIKRNPGGNRDISKAIQSLPGVASGVSFRNDIIVRGGSTGENRFYVDGIEVPNINHFATQGASGGPVGLLNVNFIEEVDFYSSAFPSARGNALSSVMEIRQINGRTDRLGGSFTLGSSDLNFTAEGPMGKKSSFIASYRKSYLEFLFKALELPFLPTYQDFAYKQTIKLNSKNEITILGLGAIDDFSLNTEANETEEQRYILDNIPVNTQWNYTIGTKWRRYGPAGNTTVVLSRNMLNNEAIKYQDNITSPERLIQNYQSQEMENKVRIEQTGKWREVSFTLGAAGEYVRYLNSTFNRLPFGVLVDFSGSIDLFKYAFFAQADRYVGDRLRVSVGLRGDGNSFNNRMVNPLKNLSPRFSASYALNTQLKLNASVARYTQLPAYTVLGYRNNIGQLSNENATYITSDHYVSGLEYSTTKKLRLSAEGFVKQYRNYPILVREGISLANLGADFGVIGNAPVSSVGSGRAYGFELLAQQQLSTRFYGILCYTFVRSEFSNADGRLAPSSWDNRHLVSATGGVLLGKNWELGLRYRYGGGQPFTPYDLAASAQKQNFDITGRGINDFSRINAERLPSFQALDIRIDKKISRKRWDLDLYLDIQNATNSKAQGQPFLTVVRDAAGNPLEDPNSPSAYQVKTLPNISGTLLPSVGIIVEF